MCTGRLGQDCEIMVREMYSIGWGACTVMVRENVHFSCSGSLLGHTSASVHVIWHFFFFVSHSDGGGGCTIMAGEGVAAKE